MLKDLKKFIIVFSIILMFTAIITVDADGNSPIILTFGTNFDKYQKVLPTDDGGLVVAGCLHSDCADAKDKGKGYIDGLILKYNKDLNVEWFSLFGGENGLGSSNFFDIAFAPDGGYIVSGNSNALSGDMAGSNKEKRGGPDAGGNKDGIIVKYDAKGNMEWADDFGGGSLDKFSAVTVLEDGYVVAGSIFSEDGGQDILVEKGQAMCVKYSLEGERGISRGFGSMLPAEFYDVVQRPDGTLVAVGYVFGFDEEIAAFLKKGFKGYIVKMDQNLNKLGINVILLSDPKDNIYIQIDSGLNSIKNTKDGGYVIVGKDISHEPNPSGGTTKLTAGKIFKFDKDDNLQWESTLTTAKKVSLNSVVELEDGSFIVVGDEFLPCPERAIAVKCSKDGKLLWKKHAYNGDGDSSFLDIKTYGDKYAAVGYGLLGEIEGGFLYIGDFSEDEINLHETVIEKVDDEIKTATLSKSKVLVNGKETPLIAYTIDGNNYFKLRDIAYVLTGTSGQFGVEWDESNKAIEIVSGRIYKKTGSELSAGQVKEEPAYPSKSPIYKDSVPVSLKAYTIGGNNYFKLRDLGDVIGFLVGWDGKKNTVTIETIGILLYQAEY